MAKLRGAFVNCVLCHVIELKNLWSKPDYKVVRMIVSLPRARTDFNLLKRFNKAKAGDSVSARHPNPMKNISCLCALQQTLIRFWLFTTERRNRDGENFQNKTLYSNGVVIDNPYTLSFVSQRLMTSNCAFDMIFTALFERGKRESRAMILSSFKRDF